MTENGNFRVLVINPGSTSDEISYFEGETEVFHKTVRYTPNDLKAYDTQPVTAQFDFRVKQVTRALEESHVDAGDLDAIIGRGGLLRPIPSGTYSVNDAILRDLSDGRNGEHPSNLGAIIAHHLAKPLNIPAFIADPVVVDELDPVARLSGMPENPRVSIFHALNQKRVARRAAMKLGKPYEECDLILLHGGGGISVGAHRKGKVVDVNNALDGEGPYTPQRSGGVPAGGLLKMAFSGDYSLTDLKLKIKGKGGLVAYTGTSDLMLLERFLDGETLSDAEMAELKPGITRDEVELYVRGMCYQISKEICGLLAIFSGKVDAIVLTGGIIKDKRILHWIEDHVSWAAEILILPGGDEMAALKDAAVRVLSGQESAQIYT